MNPEINPFDFAPKKAKAYTKQEAIQVIEDAVGIKFSDEQRRIAENDFSKPLLVNACAGSGKTTLFILTVLVAILTKQARPEEIMGITFSKMAQLDMEKRFQDFTEKLMLKDVILPDGSPYFTTFHAFFLKLLKTNPAYNNATVIPDWKAYMTDLTGAISVKSTFLSEFEQLDQIFNFYDVLLNSEISTDGLTVTKSDEYDNVFEALYKEKMIAPQLNVIQNYENVIAKYNQIKRSVNGIDFNDMKILLLNSMNDPAAKQRYLQISHQYEIAYLDEFQDIDPIQWTLCKELLKKSTFDTLISVGDDDQAIYSFRGSDPRYILNYSDWQPTEKTLNLSTNYRTAENILEMAKPVITRNPARLEKELLAHNPGGEVTFTTSFNGYFNANDNLLKTLKERILEHRDHEIAVLVRHNTDRIFISDWLANQNILTNVHSTTMVLQKDKIYKIFISLLKAIYYNDAKAFIENSKKIGFSRLEQELSTYYLSTARDNNLDALLRVYMTRVERKDWRNKNNIKNMKLVETMRRDMRTKSLRISTAMSYVIKMTADYYAYMIKNKYIDEDRVKITKQYLLSVLTQLSDLSPEVVYEQFFQWEARKSENLIAVSEGKMETEFNNVSIITLHQSKGLEFDDVFIYGINDNECDQDKYDLAKMYPSNEKFVNDDLAFDNYRFMLMDKLDGFSFLEKDDIELSEHDYNILKSMKFDTYDNELVHRYLVMNANEVEEERRLMYVGMTRAKKHLFMDIPKQGYSPILKEIPKVDQLIKKPR